MWLPARPVDNPERELIQFQLETAGKDVRMIETAVKWIDRRRFVGTGLKSGHALVLDMAEDKGGQNTGLRPTELLLLGVGGCTAIDVVGILEKMRIKLTRCDVAVAGEQAEDYPKYFHTITIKYTLSGEHLTMEAARKAVDLSMDKYCSVSQTLKGRAQFRTEIEIV